MKIDDKIIKRFEFDLNLKVFKNYWHSTDIYAFYIPKDNVLKIHNVLVNILYNLNFEDISPDLLYYNDNGTPVISIISGSNYYTNLNCEILYINMKNKTYEFNKYSIDVDTDPLNYLPKYIVGGCYD